jgi:predicted RNase H-like nuclease (RuvC/YqgF family)
VEKIPAEINALNDQIQSLQAERDTLMSVNLDSSSDSIESIVTAYRRQARENPELAAEVKGIDDAIQFLEKQLKQKQTQLKRLPAKVQRSLQAEQLEIARNQAQIHAKLINELAADLTAEIRKLKACADELSPLYWQVYYKPFITGFKTISVPYVRSDGEVWTIVNRIV